MAKSDESTSEVDPEELLRALLKISPEDAAEVRETANEKATPKKP
jgi:hypothetical protein